MGRGAGAPRGGLGGGFRGGFAGGARAATCYKCGGPNHFARDCQAQAIKCYACGKLVGLQTPTCVSLTKNVAGPYQPRLHRAQRRPLEYRWRQDLLSMRRGRPHLEGLFSS